MLAIGIILMFFTVFGTLYNVWEILFVNIIALIVCIIYEIKRTVLKQQTIGELIIGNDNKTDILFQNRQFAITRIPLFILLLITLIINESLIAGLAESIKFGVIDILYNGLVFVCIFFGFKNFFLRPDWLPLVLICGGVFLAGFIFKTRQSILLFNIDYMVAIIWLLVGIFYKSKSVYTPDNPHE